jgi:hypothetical protein
MIRDRDGVFGHRFQGRVEQLGIDEVITAPRSHWQNPYCERLIGSVRRECLDHVIVLGEMHLRRILKSYFSLLSSLSNALVAGEGCSRAT